MLDLLRCGGTLRKKLAALLDGLRQVEPGLIAVSGGLDSRFLSWFAWEHGLPHEAVFFSGPHITPLEVRQAEEWLSARAPAWHRVEVSPLAVPQARENGPERCYHCKAAMFTAALKTAGGRGLAGVMDGTNASDLRTYRPGLRALSELCIHSPLAAAGLEKNELREAARLLGLPEPDQPARPCLMTRFAYGLAPDEAVMRRVGSAEDVIYSLGFKDFRIRVPASGVFILQLGAGDDALWKTMETAVLEACGKIGVMFSGVRSGGEISGFYDTGR